MTPRWFFTNSVVDEHLSVVVKAWDANRIAAVMEGFLVSGENPLGKHCD